MPKKKVTIVINKISTRNWRIIKQIIIHLNSLLSSSNLFKHIAILINEDKAEGLKENPFSKEILDLMDNDKNEGEDVD